MTTAEFTFVTETLRAFIDTDIKINVVSDDLKIVVIARLENLEVSYACSRKMIFGALSAAELANEAARTIRREMNP